MGLWQITTDTLARSRFVLSPSAEAWPRDPGVGIR